MECSKTTEAFRQQRWIVPMFPLLSDRHSAKENNLGKCEASSASANVTQERGTQLDMYK